MNVTVKATITQDVKFVLAVPDNADDDSITKLALDAAAITAYRAQDEEAKVSVFWETDAKEHKRYGGRTH